MTDVRPVAPVPAREQLEHLLGGIATTQSICAAAKLGIADLLADGPRPAQELAATAGADPSALYRLLRALASLGVFTETEPGTFALTPMAERLRADAPDSLRAAAIFTGDVAAPCWVELMHSLRTGEPAYERVFGLPIFEHFEADPDAAATFDRSQAQGGRALHAAVAAACEFGAGETIVDLGGGNGSLMAAIVQRHPEVNAVIFDVPHVVERARAAPDPVLGDRCDYIGGSFFEAVPPGGDSYLLSRVIHDWDDDDTVSIFAACRRAMRDDARLLLIERIVPPGNAPHPSKFMDLNMLLFTGGRERTEDEYGALFQRAGLRLRRIIGTGSAVSVLEAVPG